jgi:hypothetical protein
MTDREFERAVLAAFETALGDKGSRTVIQKLEETRLNTAGDGARGYEPGDQPQRMVGGDFTAPVSRGTQQVVAQPAERSSGVSGKSVAAAFLKTGLGTAPLAHLVAKLFGGGSPKPPPPLIKYAAPAPIRLERANWSAADGRPSFTEFDYGQSGALRAYDRRDWSAAGATAPAEAGGATASTSDARAPQITVNVQAMDSRSFLDHSDDIARAVRDAMLNMHALNDVVSEL